MKSTINFNCSVSHKIDTIYILLLLVIFSAVAKAQQPSDSSSSSSFDDGDVGVAGGNVSPSMAIVVIVLVLGFFITGCIAIYIQQCVDTSSSSAVTTVTARAVNGANVVSGLDKTVIDTFPTFEYSAVEELKIGKGALECAVCLSEFEKDETLRLLPKCDHVFHSECIDTWLVGHTTCPVCRDNLVPVDTDSDKVIDGDLSAHSVVNARTNEHEDHYSSGPRVQEVQITIHEHEETTSSLPVKKLKFPRSHSTGHSLIQPGENCDRFTLKLPAEVRRQLMARTQLKRATSLVALPRQTSSRRGYRGGSGGGGGGEGSGSSRYGRFFGRSFISRIGSFRSSTTAKVCVDGDVTTASTAPKRCSAAVVTPLGQSFPPPLPV